jgi:DNA polymerase V
MTIVGVRLQDDLNGIPTLEMEPVELKQSIATTRTFETDYRTFEEVRERIVTFAVSCAEKLRSQHSLCNALTVFIESNRFRENDEQYSNHAVIKLPFPTSSAIELSEFALQGLRAIFKNGIGYKRAGVILMNFVPDNEYQQSLFYKSNPKHTLLMEAVDKINTKFGQQKVRLATQDKKIHKMRQERLSPDYTTKLSDIIEINAD